MDLRTLLNKLDTLDTAQLLVETDEMFEALTGLQYSDVEALARTLPPPQNDARAAKLGELARKYNLPGLFDPFTNNFVNSDGKFAKIGAYSSEVDVLKSKGLLPLGANTQNWGMGQDRETAQSGNLSAQAVLQKAYRADAIMDKALPKLANAVNIAPAGQQPAKESIDMSGIISQTLLEEFGYAKKAIAEAINPAEHKELKQLIVDLTPYQGNVHQVGEVIALYKSYVRERDRLIAEIMRVIARVKKRLAAKTKPSVPSTKTSSSGEAGAPKTNESINWQQSILAEEEKKLPTGGVLQSADDIIRSVANTWTGGWTDNIEARLNSWINGTTYGQELKKSLERTDNANKRALVTFTDPVFKKTWSPSSYDIGTGIGAATAFPTLGWVKTAGLVTADIAQEKYLREPHNKKYTNKAKKDPQNNTQNNQGGMNRKKVPFDKRVKDLQDQLIAIYGGVENILPKYKNDGRFGDETKKALERAKEDGYTLVDGKFVKAQKVVTPTNTTTTTTTTVAKDAPSAATTASAETSVFGDDKEVVSQLQQALGTKVTGTVSQEDLNAFKEYVKKNGGDAYTALSKLIGVSITEEAVILEGGGKAVWDFITKLFAKGAEKEAGAIEKEIGKEVTSTVNKAKPGNPNFNAQRGEKSVAADGKTYERDIDGKWWEVGGEVKNGKPTYRPASTEIQKELNDLAAKKGQDFNALMNSFVKGEKVAPEVMEKGIAYRFGVKAGKAWKDAVAKGGRVLQFMKNRKWLLAFLLLAGAGYLIWDDNNKQDDEGGMPVVPNNVVTPPAPDNRTDPNQEAEIKEDLNELVQLLNELVGGWPDDVETANTLKAAEEVGAKPSATGNDGQGGMSVNGRSGSSIGVRTGVDFSNIK